MWALPLWLLCFTVLTESRMYFDYTGLTIKEHVVDCSNDLEVVAVSGQELKLHSEWSWLGDEDRFTITFPTGTWFVYTASFCGTTCLSSTITYTEGVSSATNECSVVSC